jgi:hypothetical protein
MTATSSSSAIQGRVKVLHGTMDGKMEFIEAPQRKGKSKSKRKKEWKKPELKFRFQAD